MRRIHVCLHRVHAQEGIVEIWVDGGVVMHIDHVGAGFRDRIERSKGVKVPVREMLAGIECLEWRDQQAKIVMKYLTRLDRARSTVTAKQCSSRITISDVASAAAIIGPGCWHYQRLEMIEVRVQRTGVVLVLETHLHSSCNVADPNCILILLNIPLPVEVHRPEATCAAESHHVARCSARVGHLDADVANVHWTRRRQRNLILDVAVELETRMCLHGNCRACSAGRSPFDCTRRAPSVANSTIAPGDDACAGVHDDRYWRRDNVARRLANSRIAIGESTQDARGKARWSDDDTASKHRNCVAAARNR